MTDSPEPPHFSQRFYDTRYQQGYMEEWPEWKKVRIIALIRELQLPSTGCALDFGCGRGVFTEVLGRALPGWTITGTDLSGVAMERARQKLPQHQFISMGMVEHGRYEFLFTHHVLEHVLDLQQSWEEMTAALKPEGVMLHVGPCKNGGSVEHQICSLRRDGFQTRAGGKTFFYEDESHVRRLSSSELISMAANHKCRLLGQWYANQYYGALEWITDRGLDYVSYLCNPAAGANEQSRRALARLMMRMAVLCRLKARHSAVTERLEWARRNTCTAARVKAATWFALRCLCAIPLQRFQKKVHQEWDAGRSQAHGSEFYMAFRRTV
jgi:trans-aconitate methyltransferase